MDSTEQALLRSSDCQMDIWHHKGPGESHHSGRTVAVCPRGTDRSTDQSADQPASPTDRRGSSFLIDHSSESQSEFGLTPVSIAWSRGQSATLSVHKSISSRFRRSALLPADVVRSSGVLFFSGLYLAEVSLSGRTAI
jgi:hypothetical protein